MTPNHPCRPERVLRYVFGPCSDEERAETEDHVANCSDCRSDLDAVIRVGGGFAWREYESLAMPILDVVAKARSTETSSRAQASADLTLLKSCLQEERHAIIYRGGVAITPALALVLMEEADRILFSAPRESLTWFELACLVSDSAARWGTLLAHELRVEAWKNYAWLLVPRRLCSRGAGARLGRRRGRSMRRSSAHADDRATHERHRARANGAMERGAPDRRKRAGGVGRR